MIKYKEIEFPKDFNMSFEEFKKAFADNWVFKNFPKEKVEAEYKKAYAIATAHLKSGTDGNISATVKESEKNKRE